MLAESAGWRGLGQLLADLLEQLLLALDQLGLDLAPALDVLALVEHGALDPVVRDLHQPHARCVDQRGGGTAGVEFGDRREGVPRV
ncbi:hypothetical protein ACFQX6_49485 [Streptosporangium lutulentum]